MRTRGIVALVLGILSGCGDSGRSLADAAHDEGTVTVEGASLFYRVLGSGPDTVVVVAGGPGLPMDYLGPAVVPLRRDATWILYDPRGAGRSTGADSTVGLPRDVADLDRVRTHFRLERLTLVGHNTGAAVAARYTIDHPDRVSRLALVSPYPISQGFLWAWHLLDRDTALFRRGAEAYPASRQSRSVQGFCEQYWFWYFQPVYQPADLPGKLAAESVCGGPVEALVDPSRRQLAWLRSAHAHDWRADVAAIAVPVLVIEGVKGTERHLFQSHAETWAFNIPDARMVALKGGSLLPWLANPEPFRLAMQAFLRGGWPADAYRPTDPEQVRTAATPPPTP